MRHIQSLTLYVIILGLLLSAAGQAAIVRVTPTGNDTNDGTSWTQAKRTVQAGINAAGDGEVWVKAGIYSGCITLRRQVGVYGGFAGTETMRIARNWQTNITVLDGAQGGSVVTAPQQVDSTAILDGFTIRNGSGTAFGATRVGGGIYCQSGSSPTITHNNITGNSAVGVGGGIACDENTAPLIAYNTVSGNTAQGQYGSGGGIYCIRSNAAIIHNIIIGNTADSLGGGICCYSTTSALVANNAIRTNTAARAGGGVYCDTGATAVFANNTFSHNAVREATGYGGGICLYRSSSTLSGNTLSGNTAARGGGIYGAQAAATIVNTIIAFNQCGISAVNCALVLRNNCVFGNTDGNYSGIDNPTGVNGNIAANPQFIDATAGNLHLQAGSPCRNTGNTPDAISTYGDCDGNARVMENRVDIGADEWTSTTSKVDLQIRTLVETGYLGDNIYNTNGRGQTSVQTLGHDRTATYVVRVQNDGSTADTLRVTAMAGNSGWQVRYFAATGSEITAQITGSGWQTPLLTAGGISSFWFTVSALPGTALGSSYVQQLTAISNTASTAQDTVLAHARYLTYRQPDLWLRKSSEPAYTGDNIFSSDGATQQRSAVLASGISASFLFRVQNDGSSTDSFVVTAPAGDAGWHVRYFTTANNTEITEQITGTGWQTGPISAGTSIGCWMAVMPLPPISGGHPLALPVTARSVGDPTRNDVGLVRVAPATVTIADLLIRNQEESAYSGDNIYSADGANQAKMHLVSSSASVAFYLRVQNDGNTADVITVTGPGGGDGWTVRYFDMANNTDITTRVTTAGWVTPVLPPGGIKGITVRVYAAATVLHGTEKTFAITAASGGDTPRRDTARIVARMSNLAFMPDLWLRQSTETAYSGDGIYSTNGLSQQKSTVVAAGGTVYYLFRIQNEWNTAEAFVATATGGDNQWDVRYYDTATNADITAQITGAGWRTASLAPGMTQGCWVAITPLPTAVAGTPKTLIFTAQSVTDPLKKDVVRIQVNVLPVRKADVMIRNQEDNDYIGNNIYSIDGANQTVVHDVTVANSVAYYLRVQNDGNTLDTLIVTGTGSSDSWTIRYISMADGSDITAQVTGAGWMSPIMGPGTFYGLSVRVTAAAGVPIGGIKAVTITAVSSGDTTKRDVVKAITTRLVD